MRLVPPATRRSAETTYAARLAGPVGAISALYEYSGAVLLLGLLGNCRRRCGGVVFLGWLGLCRTLASGFGRGLGPLKIGDARLMRLVVGPALF